MKDTSSAVHRVNQFRNEFNNQRFTEWCDAHSSFANFVGQNVSKISRKIRLARCQEDEADVLAELELANLLVVNGQSLIEYEPFGTGSANPDLRVTLREESCCVEVKRINPPHSIS